MEEYAVAAVGLLNTAVLTGIFFRMGVYGEAIKNMGERVGLIETKIDNVKLKGIIL